MIVERGWCAAQHGTKFIWHSMLWLEAMASVLLSLLEVVVRWRMFVNLKRGVSMARLPISVREIR